jgi:hypothetical protein
VEVAKKYVSIIAEYVLVYRLFSYFLPEKTLLGLLGVASRVSALNRAAAAPTTARAGAAAAAIVMG